MTAQSRVEGKALVAVDFGQSWCKAAYVDATGRFVATARVDSRGLPGYAFGPEDGERIWQTLVAAVRELGLSREPVEAIGLATRIGVGVWLDANDQPIAASGVDELPFFDQVYDGSGEWTCTYAPILAARTRWLRTTQPKLHARVARAGAFHDWLLLKLTDVWATNPASGPGGRAWPTEVATLAGVPADGLPPVRSFGEVIGGLAPAAADALGLPAGTPVVAGYHDGAAATAGIGALEPGDACLTLGTSVALRVVSDVTPTGWFRYPVADDRWAWMRGLEQALRQVDLVAELLGGGHAYLTEQAEGVPPGCGGVRLHILPPEQTDHQTGVAGGLLAIGNSQGAIYRAALEGLAFGIVGLARMASDADLPLRRVIATGGGTTNPLLLRMIGACLGVPLEVGEQEGGLRGAAAAAAVGAGWHDDIPSAIREGLTPGVAVEPTQREREAYARLLDDLPAPIDPWQPRPYWRALPT